MLGALERRRQMADRVQHTHWNQNLTLNGIAAALSNQRLYQTLSSAAHWSHRQTSRLALFSFHLSERFQCLSCCYSCELVGLASAYGGGQVGRLAHTPLAASSTGTGYRLLSSLPHAPHLSALHDGLMNHIKCWRQWRVVSW